MKTDALIKDLEKDFELKDPFPQESPGEWTIQIEEDLFVKVKDLGNGFFLQSTVSNTPTGKEEALYTDLLRANLFGQATSGGVLSLSEDGGHLIISRLIDYDINYKEFKDIFDDFVNSVDFWREEALNYRDN